VSGPNAPSRLEAAPSRRGRFIEKAHLPESGKSTILPWPSPLRRLAEAAMERFANRPRRSAADQGDGAPALVVTGLAREAACLKGDGLTTICSGANVGSLRASLEKVVEAPFSCVVSFGLAGGLDHGLRPGDVVVGSETVAEHGSFGAHSRLVSILTEGLSGAGGKTKTGGLAGVDAPAMHPLAKARLRERTNAIAVDMESHVAAEFAQRRGLPFVAVRVVSDPASRALPPLAARAIAPDGSVDIAFVLQELRQRPAQLSELLRAGLDARAAFSTLSRCGSLLGPLLSLALSDVRQCRDIAVEDILGGPLLVE
jgi:hopanoid-associated phosphorylase